MKPDLGKRPHEYVRQHTKLYLNGLEIPMNIVNSIFECKISILLEKISEFYNSFFLEGVKMLRACHFSYRKWNVVLVLAGVFVNNITLPKPSQHNKIRLLSVNIQINMKELS
jgi:hypothetical protein